MVHSCSRHRPEDTEARETQDESMSAAGGLYELCDKDDERGGGCNQQHAGWGMRGRAGWAWTWELMIFRRTDAVAARRDRGSGQSTCLCRLLFSGSSLRADVFARRIALAFSFSLIFFFAPASLRQSTGTTLLWTLRRPLNAWARVGWAERYELNSMQHG